ncbi:hypothetical protein [Rhizobium sp. HT1-10]|uniref:hypothetical protein n=1 Tax=Rhizobium sp. HT1-10 TaxID=3111638 RepID=UPI003C15B6A6
MRNALHAPLLAALLTTAVAITESRAEDIALPAGIIASTSTGYWQDDAAAMPAAEPAPGEATAAKQARHGYYKLYAVRQADRTSRVYLQQIVATEDGPKVLSTTELTDITALRAIVTDIRPENSGGIIREPGLFATVFLKTDADADAEAWNVMRDELGEITVEKAP